MVLVCALCMHAVYESQHLPIFICVLHSAQLMASDPGHVFVCVSSSIFSPSPQLTFSLTLSLSLCQSTSVPKLVSVMLPHNSFLESVRTQNRRRWCADKKREVEREIEREKQRQTDTHTHTHTHTERERERERERMADSV